jgi:signal transduction histidine kinase/ActR/RegA family two-component response regulator
MSATQRPAQPIRRTLMQVIFLSCGAVLAITVSAFLGYELLTFRHTSVQQLQTLSKAIASNSTAALAFENPEDATVVLGALQADPHVVAAVLYDTQGKAIATFPPDLRAGQFPARPGPEGYEFTHSRLLGFQPVIEKGRPLGMLYVESDLDAVYQRLSLYVLIAAVVTAIASAVAWLFSRHLQYRLLQPIHALTDTARAVSDRNDYTVRAARTGALELDVLTDTFNHMLQQIQFSEHNLQAQLDRLSLLQHITRAIGDRQDLQSIHQVVLSSLEQSLRIAFTCLLNHEAGSLTLTVGSMGPASRAHADALGLTEGMAALVESGLAPCMAGELLYEPDTANAASAFARRFALAGLRSMVITPLIVENEVSGMLVCVRPTEQAFSSGECEFLRQLSEHVALASHQMRLYGSLQQAYDELRQSQLTVLQQERLRALGQMASGIAHDINNAISPVSLYTEILLERESGLSERARDYLSTIQKAIEDVARTVSRMREFYRDRETQLTLHAVEINRAVEQVVNLTRPRWSDQPQQRGIVVDLQMELAPDLPEIMGADNEIRDALTNLLFNAVDAMPVGGKLTIRTFGATRHGDARYVVIEVSDTGVGMDEDTRRRCLEPFYTTKGERGTGLGLAMVYGMIQRHSAELEIESTPGQGTTMRVIFAAAAASVAETTRVVALLATAKPLRILLVDDDPMLLRSMQNTLQQDGHTITTTHGGQTGIEAFRSALQAGEAFDLTITDLGMPYVDGRKVAAAVKALSPLTPVILLTGWGQRLIAENEIPAHVDRVLSKPPRLQELRAAFLELAP